LEEVFREERAEKLAARVKVVDDANIEEVSGVLVRTRADREGAEEGKEKGETESSAEG
jgi:hypothetical protein